MADWTVTPEQAGNRLDRCLAARLGASRSRVRRWLEAGRVTLDGVVVGARAGGWPVKAGMRVTVTDDGAELVAGGGPLDVLVEGRDWVAVNKPAGVPVHPLRLGEAGTLLNAVVNRYPQVQGVGDEGELRSGVVHRLDVDTSGVVLFALNAERWAMLRDAFYTHRVVKRYRALVAGRLERDRRHEATLAVTRHRPARVSVVPDDHPDGRRCSLAWRVLAIGSGATEIEIDLHTGFLHQVRVMMATLGHPLLGDRGYADEPVAARAPRQMLHAASIGLDDLAAEAPLPGDYLRCRGDHVSG